MFDLLTFFLSDYRCPWCSQSLRFRLVKSKEIAASRWKDDLIATSCEVCPLCGKQIKSDWHPAVLDDWLWAKRLAPGLLLWIIAMIMNFHPVMMMAGTVVLLIGFATVLHYMLTERWKRPYYVRFEIVASDADVKDGDRRRSFCRASGRGG